MSEKKPYIIIDMKEHGEFHLCKPTFEAYSLAVSKLVTIKEQDIVGAGKIIFDACYLGNNLSIEKLNENPALYTSICLIAAEEIDIMDGELKKN